MDSLEGADGLSSFIDIIGKISTVVGFGQQLEDIFGGSEPLTIADIQVAVQQEVAAALLEQAFEDQITTASSVLQSAQNFFSINYLDAVDAGEDQAALYGLLTQGQMATYLADMLDNVNALNIWMDQSDLRTAAKAIPVSLATYLYLSMIYRELAKQAATDSDREAQTLNMRKYARLGAQNIGTRLTTLMDTRMADLVYTSNDDPNIEDANEIPVTRYCTIDSLHDQWFDAWLFAFKAYNDTTMDYAVALHWSMRATRNLLWSGAQADADDLANSLTDGWLQLPQSMGLGPSPWTDEFSSTCFASNLALGKFIQGARTALLGLDAIAVGYVGKEQENWSWCSSCGSLYFTGGPSACPAAGGLPHVHEQPSGNYVLRCDPTGPPLLPVQDNWRWCKKCSGLFYDLGPRLCAAGGNHDGSASGSYELDVSPMPGPDRLGLPVAQDNWCCCTKCSGLYYGLGPSVCMAGGQHDSTGGNYWLSQLGALPQPS